MSHLVRVSEKDGYVHTYVTFGSLKKLTEIDGIPCQQPLHYNGFSEGMYTLKNEDISEEEHAQDVLEGYVTWREDWPGAGVQFCNCSRIAWENDCSPFILHAKKCRLYDGDEYGDAEDLTIVRTMKDPVL